MEINPFILHSLSSLFLNISFSKVSLRGPCAESIAARMKMLLLGIVWAFPAL